jgi:hypothetical protein
MVGGTPDNISAMLYILAPLAWVIKVAVVSIDWVRRRR